MFPIAFFKRIAATDESTPPLKPNITFSFPIFFLIKLTVDSTKAFGFIKPDEGDKDIFVHQTDLVDGTINENDKVEFETEDGPRGPKAIKVKVI